MQNYKWLLIPIKYTLPRADNVINKISFIGYRTDKIFRHSIRAPVVCDLIVFPRLTSHRQ